MDDQKNIEEIRQRVSLSSLTDKTDKTDKTDTSHDEAFWKSYWADLRKGHQKRLEQLHLESRGIRRR